MHHAFLRVGDPGAPVRLLAFHHAGGSAAAYLPFVQSLRPGHEALLFELPGRDEGEAGLRARDFEDAVRRLTADFRSAVDRPCVVFAHSMGALFAHRLVGELPADQRGLVRTVVVSAARSPRSAAGLATRPAAPFVARTRASVLADLRRFGGCPPEFFDEPQIVEHFVDVLGHDLHLADTYRTADGCFDGVPFEVWHGTEDDTLTPDDLRGWSDCGPADVTVRGFPGGHFYLSEGRAAGLALQELLDAAAAAEAA
ncbi:thioesterase domain-containing protein [Streptomyces sp. NPDC047123]|uniref:thioesterase II family protein n=1 Tax=Streptomyces sp. NPDC047123 TaxID=3155622 RepID=UPI0033D20764